MKIKTISIIGAGNVAHHLGHRLVEKGYKIQAIYSRTVKRAKGLADQLGSKGIDTFKKIPRRSDMYIIAIKDDAIRSVAQQLKDYLPQNALVYHTSGSVPSTAVTNYFPKGGVFYPLQTFSIARPANFEQLPLCLHTAEEAIKSSLEAFAMSICPNVYWVDDGQRASLHVAAVFVNNFSNHLYHIGQQICEKEQVPFDLLRPLILETTAKIQSASPEIMQTGPAIRGDVDTIQKHLNYLEDSPNWQQLYQLLSLSINPILKDES